MKKFFVRLLGEDSLIVRFLGKIRDRIDKIFEAMWKTGGTLARIKFIIGGILGLISAAVSVFFAYLSIDSIIDIVHTGLDGQDVWLDKIASTLTDYPSFSEVISSMDSSMSSMASYFSPPPTFSYILKITGIGHALNSILACAVQGIMFVINMQILKWSLSRISLTMVKPIK